MEFSSFYKKECMEPVKSPVNLTEIYKKQLLEIIEKKLPGCKVMLFGSRATGKHHEGSDLDIALDIGKPISFDTILDMYVLLDESTIPVKVDFVDMHTADKTIQEEIHKKGIIWKA